MVPGASLPASMEVCDTGGAGAGGTPAAAGASGGGLGSMRRPETLSYSVPVISLSTVVSFVGGVNAGCTGGGGRVLSTGGSAGVAPVSAHELESSLFLLELVQASPGGELVGLCGELSGVDRETVTSGLPRETGNLGEVGSGEAGGGGCWLLCWVRYYWWDNTHQA